MTILIGSKQLAAQLGVSLRTLDTLDKSGALPASLRIGHLRRWRVDDIERWIDVKISVSLNTGKLPEAGKEKISLNRSGQ